MTDGDPKEYPLLFVDHKSRLNREGRSANCPWYYDFKDVDPGDESWEDVAKLNPVDGKKFGIDNGEQIRLTSPTGNKNQLIFFNFSRIRNIIRKNNFLNR